MKLLVTGGSGFIGREVCRAAVEAGHQVLGLARRGRPRTDGWADRVAWIAADVLEPRSWRDHLAGCGAVIHCVGIAWERPEHGVTFERVNGDAAVVAVGEAERAGVGAFVYLSASAKPPFLREAYITAKRRAEGAIFARSLRGVALRSGLVYGPGRAVSYLPAALLAAGMFVPIVRQRIAAPNRALPVTTVARAALRAATDDGVRGVVDIDMIERLAAG